MFDTDTKTLNCSSSSSSSIVRYSKSFDVIILSRRRWRKALSIQKCRTFLKIATILE
jgi:hypothetical protein